MQSDNTETLQDGGDYAFNILCKDKAERQSITKEIRVIVNSTHPITAPLIELDVPSTMEGEVFNTRSPEFKGTISSLAPDAPIEESLLIIDGTTHSLSLNGAGKFSKTISPDLPEDGDYTFTIFANNTEGYITTLEGYIKVDTTGPGGCVKVGNSIICKSQPSNQGGRSTTSDTEPDQDNDGLTDAFEYQYWDCITCADPDEDSDGDGITNIEESNQGTTPVASIPIAGGPGGTVTLVSNNPPSSACTDSDNGMNYYVKGTAVGPVAAAPDDPSNLVISVSITDFCTGIDNALYEYGCNSDVPYYVYEEKYICPNGCQDGACLP